MISKIPPQKSQNIFQYFLILSVMLNTYKYVVDKYSVTLG